MRKVGVSYICDANSNTNHEIGMKLLANLKLLGWRLKLQQHKCGGHGGWGWWEFGGGLHNCASYLRYSKIK